MQKKTSARLHVCTNDYVHVQRPETFEDIQFVLKIPGGNDLFVSFKSLTERSHGKCRSACPRVRDGFWSNVCQFVTCLQANTGPPPGGRPPLMMGPPFVSYYSVY